MLSEKTLREELKRMPGFIRKAVKLEDYAEALALQHTADTITWILEDNDNG